jgi:enamine deaminase RidA (YjgF/YER057c/UK114 family)
MRTRTSEQSAAGRRRSVYIGGFGHTSPVPAACCIGNLVFSGAITGRDPQSKQMPADLDTQCVNLFGQVRQIVEAAGGGTDDIVKMTVWLRDVRGRTALNREWEATFPDAHSRPARHAIAATFDGDTLVQCDIIAVIDN